LWVTVDALDGAQMQGVSMASRTSICATN